MSIEIEEQEELKRDIYTTIPATIIAFNPNTQRATVQIDIKEQLGDEFAKIAPLEDVPIATFRSGGFSITLPIVIGDKVMLQFTHRSIDSWLMDGSGACADTRTHNLNDGFASNFCIYPVATPISNFDNSCITIKNDSNSIYIKIKNDVVEINGNVKINGNVNVSGDVVASGISLTKHIHGGVASGGAKTTKSE